MSRAQGEPLLPSNVSGAVPAAREGDASSTTAASPSTTDGEPPGRPLVERSAIFVLGALCVFGVCVLAPEFWGEVRVFPGVAALTAVISALTLLLGYWLLRRIRPVRAPSTGVSWVAVAWGFTAAAGLALLANNALDGVWTKTLPAEIASAWGAALTGPFNEEPLKLLGIVLIAVAFPRVVRGPVDGFVIGSLVGIGFQVVENFLYALGTVIQTGGVDGAAAVTQSSLVRIAVTGLGTHWALSALAGTAVGLLAAGAWRPNARRVLAAILLVLTAIVLHLFFNAPVLGEGPAVLVKVLLNLTVVLVVYFVIRHAYRRRVRAALTEEGERFGVEPAAARALIRRSGRRKALRRTSAADRAQARRRQEALVNRAEDRAAAYGS
ncbi:PrsW family intramembrane metalloprotease [Spiractinospora alimapuensis]|uniref:PrsW family intramembrane metalloprotease n=1 Tax=Spiractinospora alimapuensis TaxID=2820884 RepID=UPI001F28105A|nr:PrsW family intramembrane metalloprotease [Spiractinospora alimapuensis]QVQ53783.1 PrsW family intramembrane metalloprotease [Spiractinospora alimapuensis]